MPARAMGFSLWTLALAALPVVIQATSERQTLQLRANPIRKVVTMLEAMQKKVTEEGEKEKELYDKFMCYCSKGGKDLQDSIEAAESKVPRLDSSIKEAKEQKVQQSDELKQAQTDRSAAKAAMSEATAIREKEAKAYAKDEAEYSANIAALKKSVTSLEAGMGGAAFLQTTNAQAIKALALTGKISLSDEDRQELVSFLSGGEAYSPASGSITGILKNMGDEMSATLADATKSEEEAKQSYEGLMAAKTKEVEVLTTTIETKMKRVGELGVSIERMKNDLTDTEEALSSDKEFLANLEKGCETKAKEWEERTKTRQDELLALADTIKLLNDDDALELFKKTLPSPSSSFVQVQTTESSMRARALEMLRKVSSQRSRPEHVRVDFIALALRGKKIGLGKVVKMIDEMVANLKKEQSDDDDKKEYCDKQLDTSDDKRKSLERAIADAEKSIENAKEGIATTTEEIKTLEAGIKALDKEVAEATEQRKEEHAEYSELMASNTAAKELLEMAKNRLNKFYNPKLHKPEAEAPEAPSLADVSVHNNRKVAPPPPPETFGAYSKKTEESGGVIAMVDLLIKDLDKEMTEAKTEEKDAQADYETMMNDSAEKRTKDSKSITEKTAAKADLEGELQTEKESKKSNTKELGATLEYIHSLHGECDWLLKYFDARKEARASEMDALGKAKAVLSGADFSFLQRETGRKYLRRPAA